MQQGAPGVSLVKVARKAGCSLHSRSTHWERVLATLSKAWALRLLERKGWRCGLYPSSEELEFALISFPFLLVSEVSCGVHDGHGVPAVVVLS